jgi:leucyl/phenylalanyl-tRNA---protein transferase
VRSPLLAEEEVDRPARGDVPRRGQPVEAGPHLRGMPGIPLREIGFERVRSHALAVREGRVGRVYARSIPVEPAPTGFVFPPPASADEHGQVVVGGDLEAGTLLAAYRSGLFPMRQRTGELAWWSPDPRGVLTVRTLRVAPSLRRSRRRFEIRVDTAFAAVIEACTKRGPDEYEWITDEVKDAFVALHELGWAHSVEAWSAPTVDDSPELVGGLYGVAIGGFFGGESMFHRRADASKAALVALVELLGDEDGRFIDVQWLTPHLASLGAVEISRAAFLKRLDRALALPLPAAFAGQHRTLAG